MKSVNDVDEHFEDEEDDLTCDNCGKKVKHENDLFYDDGDYLCESCLDEIRVSEELSYRDAENDEYGDYN